VYRTDLQEVSGPIRIKLKKLLSGQIVIFRANFFRPSGKMPSCTPMLLPSLVSAFSSCYGYKKSVFKHLQLRFCLDWFLHLATAKVTKVGLGHHTFLPRVFFTENLSAVTAAYR